MTLTARELCQKGGLHFETMQKLLHAGVIPDDPAQRRAGPTRLCAVRRRYNEAALLAVRIAAAVMRIGGDSTDAIALLRYIETLPDPVSFLETAVLVKHRTRLLTDEDDRPGRIDWYGGEAEVPGVLGVPPTVYPLRAMLVLQ